MKRFLEVLYFTCLVLAAVESVNAQETPITFPPPGSTQVAMDDLRAKKPLPGLPNLNKPVFIRDKAFVCSKMGSMRNPNMVALLYSKACAIVEGPVRVRVVLPTTDKGYVDGHVFKLVQVLLPQHGSSDATPYLAWIDIEALSN